MIRQNNLTLNGTAVEITYADAMQNDNTLIIQNTSADKNVYIGNAAVTTSAYGYKLFPSQAFTIELSAFDKLYACGDTGATAAVLVVEL